MPPLLGVALWFWARSLSIVITAETRGLGESERCMDWGVDNINKVQAYDGEPTRVKCPLFSTYIKSNYTAAHASGLTLVWYKTSPNQDLEEPIDLNQAENRVSKERDLLWFWPVTRKDSGNYTCMLRNTTYCIKVAVPLHVIQKDKDHCYSQKEHILLQDFGIGETSNLTCPGTTEFYQSTVQPIITWYKNCLKLVSDSIEPRPIGLLLLFPVIKERHEANYTCVVSITNRGVSFTLTRTIAVSITTSQGHPKPPNLMRPKIGERFEVEYDQEVNLTCQAYFYYIRGSSTAVWWTIDGWDAKDLAPRVTIQESEELWPLKNKVVESVLTINALTPSDLQKNYTCFARNSQGIKSRQVILARKAPNYMIELGCALGFTLLIVVTSIVVYHCWWIEIILLYRLYFGTDETVGDGKEYDVYVSYARNAEEEEFVLTTLRTVLENDYGYKVCVYDRDSLPGGIITDETLACIWKSRRLLVILSSNYLVNGTQSLLELKAGMENMINTGQIKVILVEFEPVRKMGHVKELKRLKTVSTTIKWRGVKSQDLSSRFWKRLRVALPVKRRADPSDSSLETSMCDFV
ncbi:interleukin-1 receptor accessory protein [Callorhinchus milii]|nr:interleukin-1 receptor accessory protein [Callorhinchus milii]|eukprot:gi/632978497/ref/XP_007905946.1/ PREDICTED: interleukin-1 receptor accessory protein [Callorhinchus milii]